MKRFSLLQAYFSVVSLGSGLPCCLRRAMWAAEDQGRGFLRVLCGQAGGGVGINVTDSSKGLRACAFAQNRG